MSNDWRPGDLALCVRECPYGFDATRVGQKYTVVQAWVNAIDGRITLHLAEAPHRNLPEGGSWAYRFVKVTPPEADEFDKETIELYNKKPAKELI